MRTETASQENKTLLHKQAAASALDPSHIMQTATAFWASKVLLTAVEFDLFTQLGDDAMTADQLGNRLGIHPRGRYDFFDWSRPALSQERAMVPKASIKTPLIPTPSSIKIAPCISVACPKC